MKIKIISSQMKKVLLNVGIVIISLIISWFILAGIAYIGDKYQIPFLNSWSMTHVTIFFLFPVVAVILFVFIRKIFNLFFLSKSLLKVKYHNQLRSRL